jgi:hypothetical protein
MRPDGIVVSSNFLHAGEQKLADAKENIQALATLAGGARVPLYLDTPAPMAENARKYYLSSHQHLIAAAMLASDTFSRVLANLLIPFQGAPVPMKLFATEDAAIAWLHKMANASKGEPR